MDIVSLILRNGKNLHAGFFLPVGIHLTDGVEFTVTGFAPCGKKIDDKGFAAIVQRIDTHNFAVYRFQRHLRQLGTGRLYNKKQQNK